MKVKRSNLISPLLAGGLTMDEWICLETKLQKGIFWGSKYSFKPVIADTILGDGLQLVYFGTIDQRPYYWLIRIDSKIDIEANDFGIEYLLEPLEEEFGRVPEQFGLSKKEFNEGCFNDEYNTYKEYQEACKYPAVNYAGGHYGLIVNMVTGQIGLDASVPRIKQLKKYVS